MPTYDYECRRCGHVFEAFHGINSEPVKTCPQCKGKVKRLVGGGCGLIFKGSGFYITDYRSKEYQEKAKAEKSAETTGGKSGGKKDSAKESSAKKKDTKKKAPKKKS